IATLRNDVSTELAEFIHRLLGKNPTSRPTTAAEVMTALQPYCDLSTHRSAELPFAVPIASETHTSRNALPKIVAQSAPISLDEDIYHQPTVEPLPESTRDSQIYSPWAPKVEPLSDHDHSDVFGHQGDGSSVSRPPREKMKHGWGLLIFGAMLHV